MALVPSSKRQSSNKYVHCGRYHREVITLVVLSVVQMVVAGISYKVSADRSSRVHYYRISHTDIYPTNKIPGAAKSVIEPLATGSAARPKKR